VVRLTGWGIGQAEGIESVKYRGRVLEGGIVLSAEIKKGTVKREWGISFWSSPYAWGVNGELRELFADHDRPAEHYHISGLV
jgi:hypothetical protein